MSSKFQPFLPTPVTHHAPFRALDNVAATAAFVALASNDHGPQTTGTACAHSAGQTSAKPTLTLQRDGDRVTHVRVECGCGQVIELECA